MAARGARGGRRLAAALVLVALRSAAAQGDGRLPARPLVQLYATGGTISNLGNDARRTGAELVGGIPGLDSVARVLVEQLANVPSSSVTEALWRTLALRIRAQQALATPPAGYVITHGTDTMEETAYFLSLTVGGCEPVVVTGAMRQANWIGADGPANLRNAIRLAVAPAARARGTMVLMSDEIFAARDVTKSNTTRVNAFTAPDAGVLGLADPDTLVFHRPAPVACAPPRFDLTALGALPRVDVAYAHLGADSVAIDAFVAAGARGLVVAGVGRGGATPAMERALRRASARGVMVVVSNRTGSGRVGAGTPPDSLANGAGRGVRIGATDLNPQKARILLQLGLAAGYDHRALVEAFAIR